MGWISYALITSLLVSAITISEKHVLHDKSSASYTAVHSILTCLISLPFFFIGGFPSFTLISFSAVLFVGIIASVALFLCIKSLKEMEISVTAPLFVLTPALTSLFAAFFLGERLSAIQTGGLFVIMLGTYLLQLRPHDHLSTPLKRIWDSPKLHLLFLALFLYSVCSLMDRFILTRTSLSPLQYQVSVQFWFAIFHTAYLVKLRGSFKPVLTALRQSTWEMKGIAILTVASRLAQSSAVAIAPVVGPVIAIKRSGSLFTTLIGGEIFHEKFLLRKVFACVVMLAGIVMVVQH
jgi:drug/metabolite transporter (DMT)-like permease